VQNSASFEKGALSSSGNQGHQVGKEMGRIRCMGCDQEIAIDIGDAAIYDTPYYLRWTLV